MKRRLCSVGLDVGTTTTQLVVSRLEIENRASAFSVPELCIAARQVCYQSRVHFTPLLGRELVDAQALRAIVEEEYRNAGITRADVDTGAIIVTGETSRRENARAVLRALSDYAGDFVVATAGPDLESVLAAKGAGADAYSERTGQCVLHMDIGGGTSNLAWIEAGQIKRTGCLNVGGRLITLSRDGRIDYISPVLQGLFSGEVGRQATREQLEQVAQMLAQVLEMAAGLREVTPLLAHFLTAEAEREWTPPTKRPCVSFSGGVADCIEQEHPPTAFGDIGVLLGQAIRRSRLCDGEYRLGEQTIRATVIGAGCHSAQLSGSTVFYRNVSFPMKNLPVVQTVEELCALDTAGVLAVRQCPDGYEQLCALAQELATLWPKRPILVALETDMAKALGHALALRVPPEAEILCLDRVRFAPQSYLDVGAPLGCAIPVVVKTLVLGHVQRENETGTRERERI